MVRSAKRKTSARRKRPIQLRVGEMVGFLRPDQTVGYGEIADPWELAAMVDTVVKINPKRHVLVWTNDRYREARRVGLSTGIWVLPGQRAHRYLVGLRYARSPKEADRLSGYRPLALRGLSQAKRDAIILAPRYTQLASSS